MSKLDIDAAPRKPSSLNPRVQLVHSFDELITTPFDHGVNALCWPRQLAGDFAAVISVLGPGEGIASVNDARLTALPLSESGQVARDILLSDQQLLRACDLQPSLDCVYGGRREIGDGYYPTDVYSFHVDSATVPADTYLCTYVGASSEGLRNEEARRRVDVPETRADLLKLYGGPDDDGFLAFLSENFYDLHYVALDHARPYPFGVGNLWRIATECPGSLVPPCIHRAPLTFPGAPTRLLLIS